MKFKNLYVSALPIVSFELFPPKTEEGLARLEERLPKLISLDPAFISVTYGALGSTQDLTLELTSKIKNVYGHEAVQHLTCVGSPQAEIEKMLGKIREHNIENIVALRGDPPQGQAQFEVSENGYAHADQLVKHISQFGGFGVAVAGYPEKHVEAENFETDLQHLKSKVTAGADVIITQLFYDNKHYFRFVQRCREIGIKQPIVPGLLPILNVDQIKRITEICGSAIPQSLLQQLIDAERGKCSVAEVGIKHTTAQAIDLINGGAPGIHFYVLNQHFHITEIMQRIAHVLKRIPSKSD